ncbi:unnamed protein product [Absidia cylindrospora]
MQRRSTRLAKGHVDSNLSATTINTPDKKVKPSIPLQSKRKTLSRSATTTTTIKTEQEQVTTKKAKKSNTVPPADWRDTFNKIKVYREHHEAVVDTMGCERLAQRDAPPKQQRFQTLVALMLSSQTKDTVTSAAVKALQATLPGGLCLQSILAIDEAQLDHLIRSVGFHTKKAAYIKKTALILEDGYQGDIPDTIEGLMALPGVGPKMGYLALQCAWQKNMGIGVDVHVHRIANRLGWCRTEKGGPEETRLSLQSWLPKEHWREINPMLVGFGQIMCLPRGPKCGECPINDTCPSSTVKRKIIMDRKKLVVKQEGSSLQEIKLEQVKQETSVYFSNPKQEDIDDSKIKKENLDW